MCEFRFMKLYPAELIADTTHLTSSELGCYMRLLCSLWLHHGRLPNDRIILGKIAGQSRRNWTRAWSRLQSLFSITEDGKHIQHKRIDEELDLARENGRKNARVGKMPTLSDGKMPTRAPSNPLKNNNVTSFPSRDRARVKNLESIKEKEEEKEMYKDEKKSMVFVAWDTPEWEAWHKVKPRVVPSHSREHRRMGWHFPSRWPPGAEPQEAIA